MSRNQAGLQQQAAELEAEKQLQAMQDIVFIKHLIARNQQRLGQAYPFMYIWGTYMMVGFIGMHFDLKVWPNWYWGIASVVCSILSMFVGIRLGRNETVPDGGVHSWMYWLPFAVTMVSGFFMMFSGIVKLEYISLCWLILTGITYVSMAPLIGKGPAVIGVWLVVLAIITRFFLLDYQFIILGLFGGGSLVCAGVLLQLRRFKNER